jgi:ATP-dependent DNA ligase
MIFSESSFIYPIKPARITARLLHDRFDSDEEYVAEVKKNGWRSLAVSRDGSVELWNRHGGRMVRRPEVISTESRLRDRLPGNTIIDGEFISYRTKDVKEVLYVFDILYFDNEWLGNHRYIERREALFELFGRKRRSWLRLPTYTVRGKYDFFCKIISKDVNDGLVLKHVDSVYPLSRASCKTYPLWLKCLKPGL